MQTNSHLSVLVHDQAKIYGDRCAMEFQSYGGGEWKSISWNVFSKKVRQAS